MSEVIFDTNILIDWMFDRPQAIAELRRHERHRISRISWAEMLAGEPAEGHVHLVSRLRRFEIVEVDEAIAATAAEFRCRTRVKLLDALIYATAHVQGAVLVTRNTKDFPPTMPGIHVPYTI